MVVIIISGTSMASPHAAGVLLPGNALTGGNVMMTLIENRIHLLYTRKFILQKMSCKSSSLGAFFLFGNKKKKRDLPISLLQLFNLQTPLNKHIS